MSIQQNSDYDIVSDGEVASILDKLSPEMVMNVLVDILGKKHLPSIIPLNNLVMAYETSFKTYADQYLNYKDEILTARNNTYYSILTTICNHHNLSANLDGNPDLYSISYYTYSLLVSNFTQLAKDFFVNFIRKEKNNLFENLNLAELKKNKDSSTLYAKRISKSNSKLAIIHANIGYVVDNIAAFEVPLDQYIDLAYGSNKMISEFLINNLSDNGHFFNSFITPILRGVYRPEFLTEIRIGIGEFMMQDEKPESLINNFIED